MSKKATTRKAAKAENTPEVSGRHSTQCTICQHPRRLELEREYLNWLKPSKIVRQFKVTRQALYRHLWAFKLDEKRNAKTPAILGRIIENYDGKPANAFAVIAAVQSLAKINSRGQWIDRSEVTDKAAVFARMTDVELETYSTTGKLPGWAEKLLPAPDEGETAEQCEEPENAE